MNRESIDGDRVFCVQGFLSAEECEQHIARSEALGFETFEIGGEVFAGYRNNARVVHDDPVLAEQLWARARDLLPPVLDSQPAVGFNGRFRYYRYTGSESFAPHHDGSVRVGELTSRLTFLVYLSDVARGGETRFYSEAVKVAFSVRPEMGKALVFEHAILHEGVAVEDGSKYVLRTDVMYGPSQGTERARSSSPRLR